MYARDIRGPQKPLKNSSKKFTRSISDTTYDVIASAKIPSSEFSVPPRGPSKPEHTAKRRENVKKATAAAKASVARRRAEKAKMKAEGMTDDEIRAKFRRYPKPPTGTTWTFDDIAKAVLECDDAIESRRIIDAMTHQAALGNVKAATFLTERALGKPVQKVQLSGALSVESLDNLLPEVPDGDGSSTS